jgi:CubicO group peptidase (beta-lactamase class C family)
MDSWLKAGLAYALEWIGFQMRVTELPGCVVAIAQNGKTVFEHAFGHADQGKGVTLTTRHRFRVASHSKSFTTTGIMKLRDEGRLTLDQGVGSYVRGLHRDVEVATIAQLLSHTAGITRDGTNSEYWNDRRSFPDVMKFREDLTAAPVIDRNTRLKYSNYGFGLLGLVIEAITGESYAEWIKREILDIAGLEETVPDISPETLPHLARGHSHKVPLGRRTVFPGTASTYALAPATGFVSTAADLAHFFSQLSPRSEQSPISVDSRREMIRRQWRDEHSRLDQWVGLGIVSGTTDGWDWFGHSGRFQGYITRTAVAPDHGLAVSILTNSSDGQAHSWVDGILHILARFAIGGSQKGTLDDWFGRWWNVWGAFDLVPVGNRILVAMPGLEKPLEKATELEVIDRDTARIVLDSGFALHGELVRRIRGCDNQTREVWLAGNRLVSELELVAEMRERYESPKIMRPNES